MKKLAFYGFAFSLLIAATGSLAGDRGHGKHHGKHHYSHDRHYDYGYRHNYGRYIPYRYYSDRHGHHDYYPSYVGAALLGSAITYILLHTHNGEYCNDDHRNDGYRYSRPSEVVGCHRIEHFPDGSERRVEVPISQCL